MEQGVTSDDAAAGPRFDEQPTLASDVRSSALLLGLASALVGGVVLLTRALGA